jgi:hypothetical protein
LPILQQWPIRRQVVAITCALLVPFIAAAAWSASRSRAEDADELRDQASSVAVTAGAYFNTYLAGLDSMSSALARHPAVMGLDRAQCDLLFEAVLLNADAAQAAQQLGLPAVLKGCAPDVLHKSEHGLVRLGLADAEQITAAFGDLSAKLKRVSRSPRQEIVLQPQARPGIELIVGVRNYPGFGSLLVVGLGGMFVELLHESSARLGPRKIDRNDRTISAGSVRRSRRVSSNSCDGLGAGSGFHSGITGGVYSCVVSIKIVATSTPETPSMSEWCVFWMIATCPSSRPSTNHNSHSGRSRSSRFSWTRVVRVTS